MTSTAPILQQAQNVMYHAGTFVHQTVTLYPGFTPIETARYILDENLLLSFLGALAGLLLGKVFHRFILEMVSVEYMTFDTSKLLRFGGRCYYPLNF